MKDIFLVIDISIVLVPGVSATARSMSTWNIKVVARLKSKHTSLSDIDGPSAEFVLEIEVERPLSFDHKGHIA